jgi:tRNA(Ile)-lysidine synthase
VPRLRVAVAASGGRDSTALLHCTARAAAALGVEVVALHVQHGLSPQAPAWSAQVRRQARRWGAEFAESRLGSAPARGQSVEAWARRERHAALAQMAQAQGCSLVLLAHHRRDQAETFLLQALRGGGAEGLAAMPAAAQRQDLQWARPWLDQPREAIEAYLRRHRLRWVEDASNADPRFARNRLRLTVWPSLLKAFGDAEQAFSQAAARAWESAALADEVAALDLPPLCEGPALQVAAWQQLPPARRRNALRAWLAQTLQQGPPSSLVARLFDELSATGTACWPAPGAVLHLYRGRLVADPPDAVAAQALSAEILDLSQPGEFELSDWAGRFLAQPALEGGAAPELLRLLRPRSRTGGERFQLEPRATPRSLKKQFQARAVPSRQRVGPLLYDTQGRLVFVPGLGIDARVRAIPGAPQLLLNWVPAPAEAAGSRQRGR